jgi:hypothetical protein
MKIVDEIKIPAFGYDPDFTMSREQNPKSFKFKCKTCGAVLEIVFQTQINNSWAGRTERISEEDLNAVKVFYNIGKGQKSHNGGLAVFDRITCLNCTTPYITYCGVSEFSNSAFDVQVQGILRLSMPT